MADKINYHPYRLGNEHGEMRFGHTIPKNKFCSVLLRTGPDGGRHYMKFKSNGKVEDGDKGSTQFRCPGTFSINCGLDIEPLKSEDGGQRTDPIGFDLYSHNGDISIRAPRGTITLEAQNINLIGRSGNNKNGVVTIDGQEKVLIKGKDIECNSVVCTKIVSEKTVDMIGKSITNIFGGLVDFADDGTAELGSKGGSFIEEMMRTTENSIANVEALKSKGEIVENLQSFAESIGEGGPPQILGDLQDQAQGFVKEGKGFLSQFEKEAEEMSKRVDQFFK